MKDIVEVNNKIEIFESKLKDTCSNSPIGEHLTELFEKVISKFLRYNCTNLLETHTFYFRKEKVNFVKYFYPLKCKSSNNEIISFDRPINDLGGNNFVLIEGGAGYGKTSVMKYALLKAVDECEKIPVIIQLRDLNEFILNSKQSVKEISRTKKVDETGEVVTVTKGRDNNLIENFFFSTILMSGKYDESSEFDKVNLVKQALNDGLFLIIFDGYDEIYSDNQLAITNQLLNFRNNYDKNNFIVTSRPGTAVQRLPQIRTYRMLNLTLSDVEKFIVMLNDDERRAAAIIKSLENEKSVYYKQLLTNPLLLTMFVLTYESYPEIPKKRSEFYGNVFNTLYALHKTSQGIIKIERKTGFDCSEFEKAISAISFLSYMQGIFVLSEQSLFNTISDIRRSNILSVPFKEESLFYDLTTSISILIQDGNKIYYPHRSIQEYFVALFIQQIKDEENKKKAYKRLRLDVVENTTDDLNNIFDLLQELDPLGLKKHFVIDALSDFLEIAEGFDRYQRIELLNRFNYRVQIKRLNETEDFVLVGFHRASAPIKALEYFGYRTVLSEVDHCMDIENLIESIKDVLESSEEAYHNIFIRNEVTNEVNVSLVELLELDEEIEVAIHEHFDSIDFEKSFIEKLESDIEKIRIDISRDNSGLSDLIESN